MCHKYGHYASLCRKKEKGKSQPQHVATYKEAQVQVFVEKFEKESLLVSCLFGTYFGSSWFVDSGDSCHMAGTCELFTRWLEIDSDIYVDLGAHVKCGVEEVGTMRLQLESRGFLEVVDVLYVPELRMHLILV
jgi:hypothetical protein